MLLKITLSAAMLTAGIHSVMQPAQVPEPSSSSREVPLQVGPLEADVIDAIFVAADPNLTQRLGIRFEARMLFGINVISNFELVRNALVTRNGQPARIFDLKTGDRIRFQLASPGAPEVVRLIAISQP